MSVEKILRGVPTTEKIFRSSKRVNCFKAVDCIKLLASMNYDSNKIKKIMQDLLFSYKIFKVQVSETNPSSVDLIPGKTLEANDMYVWAEEETNYTSIIYGILIVSVILLFVMFQMWPNWLKRMVSYLRYPLGGFIAFMLIMGIMRLIVFGITYFTCSPGLWILPNLFAECGFFESFIPLYSWGNAGTEPSHDKDK